MARSITFSIRADLYVSNSSHKKSYLEQSENGLKKIEKKDYLLPD